MTRIVYVNGAYKRYDDTAIHVEDRGFQFADSIYEVIEVRAGNLIDLSRHLDRLERSLGELRMPVPMSRAALRLIMARLIRRNRVHDGIIYMQVTRGVGPRNFAFPPADTLPTLVIIARAQSHTRNDETAETGVWVKTMPDPRWNRSDIKTVMLLPACLAKDEARREGAGEVWFVDADGKVTEGASSNAWIVSKDGMLVTRPVSNRILAGVTRATAREVAAALGIGFEERAFTVSEALRAREAFLTSATNSVMPVVAIDGETIGDGHPGPLARQLRARFHDFAETTPA